MKSQRLLQFCGVGTIASSALLLLWPLVVGASPQDIAVRLINGKSGKPLQGVSVRMTAWNGPPTFRPDNIPKSQVAEHATTDAEGRAVFHLPDPPLEHVGFMLEPPMDFFGCWRRDTLSPETILRSGIVAQYDESNCGELKSKVSAKPGEVIIFEKKLTWWQQLRRELP